LAKAKPLTGYGTGTAKVLILEKRGPGWGSSDPHNDYLKIALENGLLGLFAYLSIILSLLFNLMKKYLSTNQPTLKIMALIILGLAVALSVMAFADNILRNTVLEWIFWGLAGALFSISRAEAEA